MLGCNQDITIWIREKIPETKKEVFARHILPVKCKWKSRTERAANNGTANIYNGVVIIIPHFGGISELNIKEGDIAALGVYDGGFDITGIPPYTANELKQKLAPNITTVKSVSRNFDADANTRGKHLRLTGN